MFSNKKVKAMMCALVLTTSFAATSHAAIPVIDDSNIMQQAKTYAETVKVVAETAQQVKLAMEELKALPKNTLNMFKSQFTDSFKNLKGVWKESTTGVLGNDSAGEDLHGIDKWLAKITGNIEKIEKFKIEEFPGGSRSGASGLPVEQPPINVVRDKVNQANAEARSNISLLNSETFKKIQKFSKEIITANGQIEEILKVSAEATGSKQLGQAANQLSAVRAKIDSVNTFINALNTQQQMIKTQQEISEKENDRMVAEVAKKAEAQEMQKIIDSPVTPVHTNPWKKYSHFK